MPFTRQEAFSKKVTDLPDQPSPSYTATQIKEYIEAPSDENKTFVDGLINELESSTGASNIGAKKNGVTSNIQSVLDDAQTRLSTNESNISNLQTTVADNDNRIDNIVASAGTSNTEIVDARYDSVSEKTYTTLKDRLDNTTSQLAQKAQQADVNIINQIDFVSELQKLSNANQPMNVKLVTASTKAFNVNTQLNNNKVLTYEFAKNAEDDYILALGGFIGASTIAKQITELLNATMTGTFDQTYPPNFYTTTIGDTITVTFAGTKISFYSNTENRGGLWHFILDEGLPTQQTKDISVYSATSQYKEQVLFDNLDGLTHTVKGVFQGDDPSNVPSTGAGTGRGWIYYGGLRTQDTMRTFKIYNNTFDGQKDIQALYSYSNKDFAIEARKSGTTDDYHFIPDHNAIGTAFKVEAPKIIVDGIEVTAWKDGSFITDVHTVQLVQHVKGYNPADLVNALLEIYTYHTIKDGVLQISGRIKFLQDTDIKNGYTMMFPFWLPFATKLKTSMGNVYDLTITDGSHTNLTNDTLAKSFIILNDVASDDQLNVGLAMTVDNFDITTRQGETGRGNPFSWIEHRSASMGKIYLEQFYNTTIPAGYDYKFSGRFTVAFVNGVSQFLL